MTYHICHGGREGVKQERCPNDITLFGTRKNKEPVSKKNIMEYFQRFGNPSPQYRRTGERLAVF